MYGHRKHPSSEAFLRRVDRITLKLKILHAIYYNINIHSPDKPEPNTFYVWPQKTPVLRSISAEGGQNNTEVKNLFL